MTPIAQKVKDIKQSFRQMMDGATAQSMRQKGLDYRLNWGATLPRLREMAEALKAEYSLSETAEALKAGQSDVQSPDDHSAVYHLAIALWKEDVRECKLLATMLMPPDEALPEVIDLWMEQTTSLEVAEQAAMNLYQHLPFAADKAFQWLASADDLAQLCGYHMLSRLFMRKQEPNERGINEFLDQAVTALQSPNVSLRKATMQSIIRFSELGLVYERMAKSATKQAGFDFL